MTFHACVVFAFAAFAAAGELPKSLHAAVAALHGQQLVGSFLANDPSSNMNSLQQESSLNNDN